MVSPLAVGNPMTSAGVRGLVDIDLTAYAVHRRVGTRPSKLLLCEPGAPKANAPLRGFGRISLLYAVLSPILARSVKPSDGLAQACPSLG